MTADQETGLLYIICRKHNFELLPQNHYSRLMKQTHAQYFILKNEHQVRYYL